MFTGMLYCESLLCFIVVLYTAYIEVLATFLSTQMSRVLHCSIAQPLRVLNALSPFMHQISK